MTADFQQAAIVASNQPAVDPATGVAYTQLPTTAAGASGTDYNDDGVSNGTIAFGATDASLMRNGFIYTVTGPNGQLYKTLALALNAFKKFDTTSNGDALIDSEPQLYIVNYAPDPVSESTSTSTSTSNSDSVSDSGSYSTSTSASDSDSASTSTSVSDSASTSTSTSNSDSAGTSGSYSTSTSASDSGSASTSTSVSDSASTSTSTSNSDSAGTSGSYSTSTSASDSGSASTSTSNLYGTSASTSTSNLYGTSASTSNQTKATSKNDSGKLPNTDVSIANTKNQTEVMMVLLTLLATIVAKKHKQNK